MTNLTSEPQKPLDVTCELLRAQVNEARVAYDHERNQQTGEQFSNALKRFIDFLCSGHVPEDLKHGSQDSTSESEALLPHA